MRTDPCDVWCSPDAIVIGDGIEAPDGMEDAEWREFATVLASSILFGATGHRFTAECGPIMVRPCARAYNCSGSVPAWSPAGSVPSAQLDQWAWQPSWGTCRCSSLPCSCQFLDSITLGAYPIIDVTRVIIDGAELEQAGHWQVRESRWLDRIDGQPWPSCQNIAGDPEEDPDTFGVELTHGTLVPESGGMIACLYAGQIATALAGGECELPSRATSITRQGVTISLERSAEFLDKGLTGYKLADAWIVQTNGGRKPAGPTTIASPDVPRNVYLQPDPTSASG